MFEKLAKTIAANAKGYKTKGACGLAMARVKRAWERAGCYGNVKYLLDDARFACQMRWIELNGMELDAKYGGS